jgi:hypothetical protein
MMEAERTSETLVNLYQTTRRYNPEDSHLRHCNCSMLLSYVLPMLSIYDHVNSSSELLWTFDFKLTSLASIDQNLRIKYR